MLALPPDQIHLWLAFDNEIDDDALANYRRLLLNEEERLREKRFHFEKDRKQFVITRALVRTVLSRYSNIRPPAWQFSKSAYGRPAISNGDADSNALSFNLSHSNGLVMLAVSRQQPLGVDVENTHLRAAPLDIAGEFFSREEAQALHALPPEMQHERFFQYWTLKESYIKAEGKGLSIPLDQFSLAFSAATGIDIHFHSSFEKNSLNWRFFLFQPTPHYMASVCINQANPIMPRLIMKKIIPFGLEVDFTCPILCQTKL
jgi:4'-phosphopantetheinyl transferase